MKLTRGNYLDLLVLVEYLSFSFALTRTTEHLTLVLVLPLPMGNLSFFKIDNAQGLALGELTTSGTDLQYSSVCIKISARYIYK